MQYSPKLKKAAQAITDTANMLSALAEVLGVLFTAAADTSTVLDKLIEAEHTKGGHSSHTEQNN